LNIVLLVTALVYTLDEYHQGLP